MRRCGRVWAVGAAGMLAAGCALGQGNPSTMPRLGSVDPRFQSYNVEMVEVIGGRFWKPYGSSAAAHPATGQAATPGGLDPSLFEQRTPIDLYNAKLRRLAGALGPAYLRVSGTWANTAYFADTDGPAPAAPPAGFGGVLTRAEWKGVVEFSQAVDAKLVTSFATSAGTRDKAGTWTPTDAKKLVAYTDSIGGRIAAAEFMNEPTFPSGAGVPEGYDGAAFGRDFAVFKRFFRASLPDALLVGPGSVGEGTELGGSAMKLLPSKDLLSAMGPDAVDVFSYHFYGAVSSRCSRLGAGMGGTTPEAALGAEWLGRTDQAEAFYAGLRDRYAPGKPLWVTETGQAACGGDRWASTFVDAFRYLDQMGSLAKRGVQVIFHNTLAASDYGLLDEQTLTPRPNYWAALLWHRTMGTTVLDAGAAESEAVHVYAHCMKDRPGGVTLLALNLDRSGTQTLRVPEGAVRYALTARDLTGGRVMLNGVELSLAGDGSIPALEGVPARAGKVELPPASITFLTIAGAENAACR